MEKVPYFSVIVPAYQAEKTIKRCIDSIVNQSYRDFEIIIINDGSTDNTYNICKEYEADNRVRIISQSNKGISITRQLGLDFSRGKYIQFIDSDDWVDTTYFEYAHALLNDSNYDVVLLDYYAELNKDTRVYKSLRIKDFERKELIKGLATNIPGVLWNKIIKRDVFSKYKMGFNSGLSYCEDWVLSYELFNNPLNIYYYPKAFYHYDLYSNTNSLVRAINGETLRNRYAYLEYIQKIGIKTMFPEVYATQYAEYAYIVIRANIYRTDKFRKEFSDMELMKTYLSMYKKIVLLMAYRVDVRVAYYFDCIVRKLCLHH